MRLRYMGLSGVRMLQFGCSEKTAKDVCAREAIEDLTWSHFGTEGSGSFMAKDSFGHKFYVIRYEAE